MFGLFSAEWRARQEEYEKANFEKQAKSPTEWDAKTTKWAYRLVLNGKTYNPESLIPEAPVLHARRPLTTAAKEGLHSPSGRFVFYHTLLPRGTPLALYQPAEKVGQVRFTAAVKIPVLAEWKRGGADLTTWMSLTPSEMLTQRNGVRQAKGDVVVYGLGLGWFLAQVCAKPSVRRVTVVERERELLDWLGPKVREKYPQTAKVADWLWTATTARSPTPTSCCGRPTRRRRRPGRGSTPCSPR